MLHTCILIEEYNIVIRDDIEDRIDDRQNLFWYDRSMVIIEWMRLHTWEKYRLSLQSH